MPAPDFTVLDNDGNEVNLSDFFGKPILLNFWASWCPPCRREMPHYDKVKFYGITSIPQTFFIDKDGNIVSSYEGSLTEEKLLQYMELIR